MFGSVILLQSCAMFCFGAFVSSGNQLLVDNQTELFGPYMPNCSSSILNFTQQLALLKKSHKVTTCLAILWLMQNWRMMKMDKICLFFLFFAWQCVFTFCVNVPFYIVSSTILKSCFPQTSLVFHVLQGKWQSKPCFTLSGCVYVQQSSVFVTVTCIKFKIDWAQL